MNKKIAIFVFFVIVNGYVLSQIERKDFKPRVTFTRKELRKRLDYHVYMITQVRGREPRWVGHYIDHFETGKYHCVVCDEPLFSSDDKYKSRFGWASFNKGYKDNVVQI